MPLRVFLLLRLARILVSLHFREITRFLIRRTCSLFRILFSKYSLEITDRTALSVVSLFSGSRIFWFTTVTAERGWITLLHINPYCTMILVRLFVEKQKRRERVGVSLVNCGGSGRTKTHYFLRS